MAGLGTKGLVLNDVLQCGHGSYQAGLSGHVPFTIEVRGDLSVKRQFMIVLTSNRAEDST
jgi:hypothetical protein